MMENCKRKPEEAYNVQQIGENHKSQYGTLKQQNEEKSK